MSLIKIDFKNLNKPQRENYNYQKIASVLAEYGYSCMWLNDDWQGADFIANHIDGFNFLKVQLKGRLTIDKKYSGKKIYIAFRYEDATYLYPHDEMIDLIGREMPSVLKSLSWENKGVYHWKNPLSDGLKKMLNPYRL